jgi:LAS superfamily LD-carboxypeptidase LdcB
MDMPRVRSRRALAGALVLGAAFLSVPATVPSSVEAVGRLPSCRLADILTVPRDYDSWSTTLVDWLLRVEKDYKPPDLVPVTDAGIAGAGRIRKVAIDDLRAMAKAAAEAGTPIAVNSPYRSYKEQVASFNGWADLDGYGDAITYSQRPGHSEHQLGLTIDFMTAGGGSALQGDWATTPSGGWMAKNAWKYGWVMSYPKGKGGALFSDVTCFHYEPWHYRYLGRRVAAKVHRSGLTIREYLWKHYTMVDPKTGKPLATATPSPLPTPSPSPEVSPSPISSGPQATSTPTAAVTGAEVDGWLGFDPSVVLVGGLLLLLVVASGAVAAWRGLSAR